MFCSANARLVFVLVFLAMRVSAGADSGVIIHKLLATTDHDVVQTGVVLGGSFGYPVINNNDVVGAFHYTWNGPIGPNASLFTFTPPAGNPSLGLRANSLPGTAMPIYGLPQGLVLNSQGSAFSTFALGSTSLNDSGLWVVSGGAASYVSLASTTPAGASSPITSFSTRCFNNSGQFAFTGGTNTSVAYIMSNTGGSYAPLVRPGSPVPGISGTTFSSAYSPVLNDKGHVALLGTYPTPFSDGSGVFVYSEAGGQLIACNGAALPGYPSGSTFGQPLNPSINNADQVAFNCRMWPASQGGSSGVWRWTAGNLELLAGQGQAVPDRPGLQLGDLSAGWNLMNGAGHVAFTATLIGSGVTTASDKALLLVNATGLHTIFREGDPAPGLPAGTALAPAAAQGSFALNAADQVAFGVKLTGPGITSANDEALYLSDLEGVIHLIAREGDPLIVDGVTYDVTRVGAQFGSGGEDGLAMSLSPSGLFTFSINYAGTANRALLVASVPEPALSGLLLLPALALMRRRRGSLGAIKA